MSEHFEFISEPDEITLIETQVIGDDDLDTLVDTLDVEYFDLEAAEEEIKNLLLMEDD